MKKISLVTSAILLSSSVLMAETTSVKEAFTQGKPSGDVSLYYQNQDNKNASNSGYSSGSVGLNYETDSFYGFSAAIGVRGNAKISQKDKDVINGDNTTGDYKGAYQNHAIINVASVKYATDAYFVSVGRQEIDLEWLNDYNEAAVAGITAIADTTIIMGYTNRKAEIGLDIVEDFYEVTKKGAYVIDVKNKSIKNIELNPYIYSAPDEANFYGFKASFDNDMFGATAHYATTHQDDKSIVTTENGDILNLEGRVNVADVAFSAGYVKTDKNGTGSLTAYGDNISPFEDGNNLYGEDAKTYYGSVGYEISGVELLALYGQTKYNDGGTKEKEAELNLSVGYNFTEELSASLMYVDYNDKSSNDTDYDKILASVSYSF